MLSTKVITFTTFLVVIIAVILSVTAAPLTPEPVLKRQTDAQLAKNVTALELDSIAVSSTGGDIKPYNNNDVGKGLNKTTIAKGNSAKGDGAGL
ncbi:hypothetical protein C1645_834646 [Glomus cerebriforme]|uniref:Uncharacterized protein n=1 Tax=Glomus cerebriforme TaxID=658196 RepID=A0A397SJC5_9GLOM|nr:hypothetical protein C1645_834646 [Glomus cerebriforme]